MRLDLEEKVEMIFGLCLFDRTCMDEEFTKSQIRTALESLTDEEYARIISIKKLKD